MFAWAVVDVFVEQLSVPPVVAQTVGSQKASTTAHTTTRSTLSEPQLLWAATIESETTLCMIISITLGPALGPH